MNWYQYLHNITTVRTDLSSAGDGFCPQSKTHRACKEDRSFLPFRLILTLSCPLLSVIGSIISLCFENEPPLILSKELFSGGIEDWTRETAEIEPRLPWVPEVVSRVQQVRRVRSDASESAAEMKSWGLWHLR